MNKRKEKLRARQAPRETGTMTGELHMARNGAGFLVDPETNEATWIEREDLGTALVGDTVTVKLKQRGTGFRKGPAGDAGKKGPEGRILRIDARAPRSIVGTTRSASATTFGGKDSGSSNCFITESVSREGSSAGPMTSVISPSGARRGFSQRTKRITTRSFSRAPCASGTMNSWR